jgi:hypothetical protein
MRNAIEDQGDRHFLSHIVGSRNGRSAAVAHDCALLETGALRNI